MSVKAIGHDDATASDAVVSFALGDRVICLRNSKAFDVINGTRGRVSGYDGKKLSIETPLGRRELPRTYLMEGFLGHGYASTVHKTQGATYDQAFVLASASLTREAGYVAMSRARHSSELFVVTAPIEHGHGPDVSNGNDEPLAVTAYRLSVSRSKQLATDYIDARSLDVPSVDSLAEGFETGAVGTPGVSAITEGDTPRGPTVRFNSGRGTGVSDVQGQQELPDDRFGTAVLQVAPSDPDRGPHEPTNDRSINVAVDFTGSDQPTWIVNALGTRPAFVDEQPRYDEVAAAITKFRERYGVKGDDPLGLRPFAAHPRLDFDAVSSKVRDYERYRWRVIEPPTPDLGLGL